MSPFTQFPDYGDNAKGKSISGLALLGFEVQNIYLFV